MIIKHDESLQRVETPEGKAIIINKFKSDAFQINIYVLNKGEAFHLNPPGTEGAVKSYTVMSGEIFAVQDKSRLVPGDIVMLSTGDEVFPIYSTLETQLLVHSLNDNSFDKTTENFRYIYDLLCKIQDKDAYTLTHSNNVHDLVKCMAEAKGYSGQKYIGLLQAAKYHDVGKIFIPDEILNKPDKLTEEEYAVMKEHVLKSKALLNQFFVGDVFSIASQHHERLDGTGYPLGLTGEAIHESAKIIAICDSYDAMTSNRVYKIAKTHEEAMEELESLSGTKYDADLVALFKKCMRKRKGEK